MNLIRSLFPPDTETSLCYFCQEFGRRRSTSSSILQPWNYTGVPRKSLTASFLSISWVAMEPRFSWVAVRRSISLIKTWSPTAGKLKASFASQAVGFLDFFRCISHWKDIKWINWSPRSLAIEQLMRSLMRSSEIHLRCLWPTCWLITLVFKILGIP